MFVLFQPDHKTKEQKIFEFVNSSISHLFCFQPNVQIAFDGTGTVWFESVGHNTKELITHKRHKTNHQSVITTSLLYSFVLYFD
jgi:hypothetical protein